MDMTTNFKSGDTVAVRWAPSIGHTRTPHYVKGKTGVVERVCGDFANPEELAYRRDGLPLQTLYRVRFSQLHLWPDYSNFKGDTVDVEIYEQWLKPAENVGA